VLLQHPDTLTKFADELIAKMNPTGDMFKLTVNWLINHYSKSKIMGLDAVYVHMAEKYYLTGKAYWADSATIAKLEERAKAMAPTLIGKKAPAINLFDTTGNRLVPLYSVQSPYTILYFWDSGCGHCKKETPKLKKIYDVVKDKGVEVYAVGTELETEDWKKYIKENDLDWINVSDTPDKIIDNFRQNYDIYATPKAYLLDAEKKIIVKQVGVYQLGQILKDKLKLPADTDYGLEKPKDDEEEEE
ncbi:MAG: peroxiredoxin family protein, partial [Luteibaculum sp.]